MTMYIDLHILVKHIIINIYLMCYHKYITENDKYHYMYSMTDIYNNVYAWIG